MTLPIPVNANILIAAEKPASAAALDGLLRGAGYANVRMTSDGREVLPLHAHWPYAVLILDMHMRTMSSLDVLAALAPQIDAGRLSVVAMLDERNDWLEGRALALGVRTTICGALTRDAVVDAMTRVPKTQSQVA